METVARFVGRRTAQRELQALIERRSARGGLGLVIGEAGIGKTTLAEVATSEVPRLRATTREGWSTPPLWLWEQVLRDARRRGWIDATTGTVDGGGALGSGHERFRRFDDLAVQLLTLAEEHDCVVVLDDLQWADAESAALLEFITPELAGSRLVIVATARPDELERLPRADVVVELGGLDADDLRDLLTDLTGQRVDDDLIAVVAAHTGGNPLFVAETARLLDASGGATDAARWRGVVPEGVRAVLARRLARLPQPTHDVLVAAAVLGGEVDATALAAMVDMDRDDADERLVPALTAGLVRDGGGGRWQFSHALVRDAVLDAIAPARRRALHRRAAAVLEVIGGERLAAAIAEHHAGAGEAEAATVWARRAADAAWRAAMYADAVVWYRRAAGDEPDAELRCRLGDALSRTGQLDQADAEYMAAARDARRRGDVAALAHAALGIGTVGGGFEVKLLDDAKLTLLHEALAALGDVDSATKAVLEARLSVASTLQAGHERRAALATDAIAIARRIGDQAALACALGAWCDAHAGPDDLDERIAAAQEMLAASRWAGDPELELLALRLLIVAHMELGDVALATRGVEQFAHLADRLRQPHFTWYARLAEAMLAFLHGDLDAAQRLGEAAAALGHRARSANARMLVDGALLPLLARERGEPDYVERIEEMNRDHPEASRNADVFAIYSVGYGGDPEEVRAALAAAPLEVIDRHDGLFLLSRAFVGDAGADVGDVTAMDAVYDDLVPFAERLVLDGTAAVCHGPVAATLARIAIARGDHLAAGRWAALATRILQTVGAPLLLARLRRELAATGGVASVGSEAAPTAAIGRDGDDWVVTYGTGQVRLRHAKGLSDLAVLLARPGREVHVLDLVAAAEGRAASSPGAVGRDTVIDATARAAYEQRIRDLVEDIDEAQRDNDVARAERLEDELDALTAELTRSLGLGGRSRRTVDDAERARKAVNMRLRATIDRIDEQHPSLGHHLRHSVRTGIYCSYRPEQDVVWQTTS